MGGVITERRESDSNIDHLVNGVSRFNVHEAYLFAVQQAGRYTPKGRIDTSRGAWSCPRLISWRRTWSSGLSAVWFVRTLAPLRKARVRGGSRVCRHLH